MLVGFSGCKKSGSLKNFKKHKGLGMKQFHKTIKNSIEVLYSFVLLP
jgi:hypothetical protein